MKNLLLTLLVVQAISLNAQLVQSNIRLNVQGILRTASGIAVPDGPQNVTFKLYTAASGGAAEWEEPAQVTVTSGIYSYNLGGGQTPIDPNIFANRLFLGVTVDGTELLPRAELTFSPYSIRAFTVACSGAVGDVKYSILNPDEFRLENGECWVPMDGRSIAGSKLATRTGLSIIPDGGGLFIRSQEFSHSPDRDPGRTSSSQVGTIQEDDFKSHRHTITDPGHRHGYTDRFRNTKRSDDVSDRDVGGEILISDNYETEVSTTNITINYTGGTETRPKNINLWTYIRIN